LNELGLFLEASELGLVCLRLIKSDC